MKERDALAWTLRWCGERIVTPAGVACPLAQSAVLRVTFASGRHALPHRHAFPYRHALPDRHAQARKWQPERQAALWRGYGRAVLEGVGVPA